MSELKAISNGEIYNMIEYEGYCETNDLYYLKYEADKVIAELEERIADGDKDFETADNQNERLLQIVRHNKYKRCLAMASYWVAVSYQCVDDKHRQRAEKHHRKWLDIAVKFKDKDAK